METYSNVIYLKYFLQRQLASHSSAIAQILVRNEISLAKPNNVPKSD